MKLLIFGIFWICNLLILFNYFHGTIANPVNLIKLKWFSECMACGSYNSDKSRHPVQRMPISGKQIADNGGFNDQTTRNH